MKDMATGKVYHKPVRRIHSGTSIGATTPLSQCKINNSGDEILIIELEGLYVLHVCFNITGSINAYTTFLTLPSKFGRATGGYHGLMISADGVACVPIYFMGGPTNIASRAGITRNGLWFISGYTYAKA